MPYRDSDSDDSSPSRYRRKKKPRSRSSSSSSDDHHRQSKKLSRHRRHRSRSSSYHSSSKTSRRRRSRSTSRYRRSRSRSSSPRRRPRSRSPKHKSHKSHSASGSRRQSASSSSSPNRRSSSPSPSKSAKHFPTEAIPRNISDADRLKMKIQQVIKAAATANAELREKGLLSEEEAQLRLATPSVSEQLERAKIIDEINAPSFTQQSFVSRKKDEKKDSSRDMDNHAAAIFGSLECLASATKEVIPLCNWREKPELLVHENLLESTESKLDRWRKKLSAERRKRINGVALGHLVRADT